MSNVGGINVYKTEKCNLFIQHYIVHLIPSSTSFAIVRHMYHPVESIPFPNTHFLIEQCIKPAHLEQIGVKSTVNRLHYIQTEV